MTKQVRDWNKDKTLCEDMLMNNLKSSRAVLAETPEMPLYWLQQYAAEKQRADKAERKELKLKESLEHCIEQYPLYDSKEIAASLMVEFMSNVLSILCPKEEETK